MTFHAMIHTLALALAIAFSVTQPMPAVAGETDPLFINTTTDDGHRATMALMFASKQQERKHPVTVFLNDKGVLLAAKVRAKKNKAQQDLIAGIIKAGGSVYVCPNCLKHYGLAETALIEGVKLGNPDLLGAALFKDNTKTLTW